MGRRLTRRIKASSQTSSSAQLYWTAVARWMASGRFQSIFIAHTLCGKGYLRINIYGAKVRQPKDAALALWQSGGYGTARRSAYFGDSQHRGEHPIFAGGGVSENAERRIEPGRPGTRRYALPVEQCQKER